LADRFAQTRLPAGRKFNYLLTNPCFLLLGVRESSISVGMQKIKFVYAHFILYINPEYRSKPQVNYLGTSLPAAGRFKSRLSGKIIGSQKPEL
jgi:hypothetical protein